MSSQVNLRRHPEALAAVTIISSVDGVASVDARHRRGAKIQISFTFGGRFQSFIVGVCKESNEQNTRNRLRTFFRRQSVELPA